MTDVSRFSKVDEALWSAIQDTAQTPANTLNTWRIAQRPGGTTPGKDFDDGHVPAVEDIRATDFPALLIPADGELTLTERGTAGQHQYTYLKAIVGAIRAKRTEVETAKKVKRFAELVMEVVLDAQTHFDDYITGDSPVCYGIEILEVTFPRIDVEGDTLFTFQAQLDITIAIARP